ncbi:MAG: GspE/PulE family protein, partial [Terriglobia bacterium]
MSTQTLVARFGEILLKESRINDKQLQAALDYQKQHGGKLGDAMVKLGFITDEQVSEALGIQYGIPSIRLREFPIDPAVVKIIPVETAAKHHILALVRTGSSLTLAMSDPANVSALDDVKFLTGLNIEPVIASEASIEEAIKEHYGTAEEAERQKEIDDLVSFLDEGTAASVELDEQSEDTLNLADIEKAAEEAPVIRLVNYVLTDAVKRGASDIHMEPYEKEYRVRYRIDGLLQ